MSHLITFVAGGVVALVLLWLYVSLDWKEVRIRLFGLGDPRDCKRCGMSHPACQTGRTPRGGYCCGSCLHTTAINGENYYLYVRRLRAARRPSIWKWA